MADKKPFDPVVPVEGDPNAGNLAGIVSGSGLAVSRGNNTKVVIIGVSIFASIVIYFMLFAGGEKKDTVDNRQIVQANRADTISTTDRETMGRLNDMPLNYDNTINLTDVNNFDNNRELLELPTLPTLPDAVKESIESDIAEGKKSRKNEEVFTKTEVDNLINEKLKAFEDEIKKSKDESERLAKEIERQRILEEEDNTRKKKGNIISNVLSVPGGGSTTTKDSDPFADPTANDPLGGLTEQEKKRRDEEERQMQMAQRSKVIEERKSSTMFKIQGGGGEEIQNVDNNSIIITNKDLLNKVEDTKIEVQTTKAADLSRTILQGKIIGVVLETSIDTDVPSQVRAVVTRDIYSESEKNILIPRGSKVIGSFRVDGLTGGVAKINIVWSRIIRSDGLSINISANTADDLGRGGVTGDLDNKYAQTIQNALLSSVVSIGTALLTEKVSGSVGITNTTNATGTTTTSGKASDYAIVEATQKFSQNVQDMVDKLQTTNPTLRVAQGARINVVVNQDLNLPIFKQKK